MPEKSLEFGDWVLFGKERATLILSRAIGSDIILNDLGFMRGCSAFEVASARQDAVFHFQDHLARLQNSARGLGISLPGAFELLPNVLVFFEEQLKRLLARNGFKSSLVWFYVLAGPGLNGVTPIGESRLLVRVSEFDESSLCNPKGISVKMVPHKRQMPSIKFTGDYALAVALRQEFGLQGYDEILYTGSDGRESGLVFEFSQKNLFVVKNGVLITPEDDVLQGITRKIVIALAKSNGIEIREERIPMTTIWNMDEIFATSTTSGVVHVNKLDSQKLELGPVTKKLQAEFLEYREEYFKKHTPASVA